MTAVLPDVAPVATSEDVWVSPALSALSARLKGRLRIGETGILAVVCLVGYLFVAVWMRDDLHYFVNDALSRTSDAVFVTVGRDPHVGAIGFYWPPLPQLIECPLVPFLEPFGRSDLAGPISSAACMALTIPVLGRLCARLHLSRSMRFGICLVFAINPVTVYYAAVGMSEACSILFLSIAMLGFLTFIRSRSTPDLIIMTVGLCGAVLTRLEAPFVTVVIAVVASFEWRQVRRSLWTATLIGLPPAVCFGTWMLVQWVLVGSPLFFHEQPGQPAPTHAAWLPNTGVDAWSAVPWALHWAVVLGPLLVLAAFTLVWRPWTTAERGTIGILGAASVFVVIQIDQLISHTTFGDPRYFVTCIMFATIAAAWLASTKPTALGHGWNLSLIALLIVGGVTGPRALSNGLATRVEGECTFYLNGPGRILPFLTVSHPSTSAQYCNPPGNLLAPWQNLDKTLDKILKPQDRVLADNDSNFDAVLYTTKPNQFVVRNDRDWQKIVANPVGTVDYIVTATGTTSGGGVNELPDGSTDAGAQIIKSDPTDWRLIASFKGAAAVATSSETVLLYKYDGPPVVSTAAGNP